MALLAKLKTVALVGAAAGVAMLTSDAAFAASSAYCKDYAARYANSVAPPAEVVGGTIGGAGVGAVIGGISRGSRGIGPGALIGGAIGTVAGAAVHSAKWNDAYNYAFDRCMGSGAVYGDAPEPWTPEWYDYCDAKFRSFDPADGTFQPFNGPRRLCR
ncbi:MAG: BA14K family protein [Hyphomicrobiales bacterium]|nr:BA14K family protein [Hyphomicrobiales bacterium]